MVLLRLENTKDALQHEEKFIGEMYSRVAGIEDYITKLSEEIKELTAWLAQNPA